MDTDRHPGEQRNVLHLTSTGEIRFTGNDDRAGVAGSLAHKLGPGAPLPTALAGALIGRIDNGLPFGIGDSSSITAPASGLLYLATNDDNVSAIAASFRWSSRWDGELPPGVYVIRRSNRFSPLLSPWAA
jgi:hypothetical protein